MLLHPGAWFGGAHGVIAQNMGEYGALGAAGSALADAFATTMDSLRSVDQVTWALVAVAAFLIWFFFLRRK